MYRQNRQNAFDGSLRLVDVDDSPNEVITIHGKFPRQGLTDKDIVLPNKAIGAPFDYPILWEHLEEVGIGLHTGALEQLIAFADERLPQHGNMGRCLDLRDVHLQLLLVPIGQAQKLVGSQYKRALPRRRLVRHLVLLHHIAANQDHKRQAHGQAHRLDGGV